MTQAERRPLLEILSDAAFAGGYFELLCAYVEALGYRTRVAHELARAALAARDATLLAGQGAPAPLPIDRQREALMALKIGRASLHQQITRDTEPAVASPTKKPRAAIASTGAPGGRPVTEWSWLSEAQRRWAVERRVKYKRGTGVVGGAKVAELRLSWTYPCGRWDTVHEHAKRYDADDIPRATDAAISRAMAATCGCARCVAPAESAATQ